MRVTIIGPSMEPALRNGEVWLAWPGRIRPGRVVVFTEPGRPDLLSVKRVVRAEPGGWWVHGDNPDHSRDSRQFGAVPAAAVHGIVRRRLRS